MMDPLSIAASISGLLTLAGSVLSSGYGYVGSVRGAPMGLHRLLQETDALKITLDQMSYLADPSKQSNEGTQIMENMTALFKSGIFKECTKILESVNNSIKRCEQHDGERVDNVLRSAIWTLKERENKATLDSLRGLSEAFSRALSIDTALSVQDIQEKINEIHSNHRVEKQRRAAIDNEMLMWKTENDKRAEKQDHKQQSLKDERLLEWLSPVNEQISHNATSEKHHEGTGTWIFKNRTFRRWLDGHISLLWLYAKAGAGKTNLVSTIINSISKECKGARKALAFFYCDFRIGQSLDTIVVIGSILRQLISKLQFIPSTVRKLYNECQGAPRLDLKTIYDIILKDLRPEFDQIFVIIDGVDECTDRSHLLSIFEESGLSTSNNLKWLISSRREIDIERVLSDKPAICIEDDCVSEDVSIYVKYRIETDERLQRLPEMVKSKIVATLIAGANGMFRWVECQLEALGSARSIHAINQTLVDLPRSLDETYVRILQKIPLEDQELARRALTWIVSSKRPISLLELAEAVIIEEDIKDIQPEARLLDVWEIIEICSGFVSVTPRYSRKCLAFEETKHIVSLTHYSVKEFLLSSRITTSYPKISKFSMTETDGHAYLARICLTYMAFDGLRPMSGTRANVVMDLFSKYPLFVYAFFNWAEHCDRGNHEFEGWTYERLFGGKVCCFPRLHLLVGRQDHPSHIADIESSLMLAATVGCLRLVEKLVARWPDANEREKKLGEPIEYRPVSFTNTNLLQPPELQEDYEGSQFVKKAISQGHHRIVTVLIESGANFDGFNSWSGFPYIFAKGVDCRMAKILLDHGADPNSQLKGKTAIERAAAYDVPEMVQLLLEYGADPHLGNPLGISKAHDCVKVTRLLENLGVRSKGKAAKGWQVFDLSYQLKLSHLN